MFASLPALNLVSVIAIRHLLIFVIQRNTCLGLACASTCNGYAVREITFINNQLLTDRFIGHEVDQRLLCYLISARSEFRYVRLLRIGKLNIKINTLVVNQLCIHWEVRCPTLKKNEDYTVVLKFA